jgi:putative hydrolase of the HAD superfamily
VQLWPVTEGVVVPIAGVIFDWGGTLTPWHVIDADEAWATLTDDPEAVKALRAAEDALWVRSRDHHLSATLEELLSEAGATPDADALARLHGWWDQHTFTDPDAAPMFEALREQGLRIGILSNTIWSRERHEAIFARDGMLDLIDGAVYSSEIEWTKPHPLAFRAALDAVGIDDAADAVYVGDRLFDDIYGAGAAGLRTIYIPHSDIPAEQIGHTLGEPDAVLHRLSEIPAIVSGWRAGPNRTI